MAAISVLLVGTTRCAEFHHVCRALGECAQLTTAENVEAAEQLLAYGKCAPDVLVLAQSYPGQWSAAAVERLRRLAPLARLVGLLGSWCEGEERTGRPWPAAIRGYWHQWPARAPRQFQAIQHGKLTGWSLPVTATEEDRLLCEVQPGGASRSALVVVCSSNRSAAELLCDACLARGWPTVWLRPDWHAVVGGVCVGIFDGLDLSGPQLDRLRRLCKLVEPAPVLALVDYLRIEDVALATQAGATAVLAKPVHLVDLYWQLDELAALATRRTTAGARRGNATAGDLVG